MRGSVVASCWSLLAECVDWQLAVCTQVARCLEKIAKGHEVRRVHLREKASSFVEGSSALESPLAVICSKLAASLCDPSRGTQGNALQGRVANHVRPAKNHDNSANVLHVFGMYRYSLLFGKSVNSVVASSRSVLDVHLIGLELPSLSKQAVHRLGPPAIDGLMLSRYVFGFKQTRLLLLAIY